LSFGLRIVFFITIPSAAGMAFLRVPIVRLLFESGEFFAADTLATAFVLLFYVPGLIAQSALQVTTRGFYSLQDTKTPVKIGFVTVVLNFLLSLAFLQWTNLGAGGLAFAYSLSSIFNMVLALGILGRRLPGFVDKRLLSTFVKSTIASVLMGGSAFLTVSLLESHLSLASKMGQLIQTFVGIGVGVLVYFVLSIVLKMEETQFVLGAVRKKLKARAQD
ncbi:MAG: murein biosynthesis integral membrane protein MurJ, partial [Firmicutes bacterium]|nr:murein biosynthesis integral membrane protein MurJ [Bacillota bacterium]